MLKISKKFALLMYVVHEKNLGASIIIGRSVRSTTASVLQISTTTTTTPPIIQKKITCMFA